MNKVYLAVDKDGTEIMSNSKLNLSICMGKIWRPADRRCDIIELPSGTIRKLIGMDLTWEDEPVELSEQMVKGG